MLRGSVLCYLMLFTVHTFGQYHFETSANSISKRIFLELEIIDELKLFNSENEGEFRVKESGREQDRKLSFEDKEGSLYLSERILDLGRIEDDADKVCSIEPDYNTYELFVPVGVEVYLSIVYGNFKTHSFNGQLNLMVEKGIIRINDLQGDSKIKINAGKVFVNDAADLLIDAETNMGIIIADQGIGVVSEDKRKLNSTGTGKNSMLIRAIMANIYFNAP